MGGNGNVESHSRTSLVSTKSEMSWFVLANVSVSENNISTLSLVFISPACWGARVTWSPVNSELDLTSCVSSGRVAVRGVTGTDREREHRTAGRQALHAGNGGADGAGQGTSGANQGRVTASMSGSFPSLAATLSQSIKKI